MAEESKDVKAARLLEESNKRREIESAISEAQRMEREINDILSERNALMAEYTKNVSSALDEDIKLAQSLLEVAKQTDKSSIERKNIMADILGMQATFNTSLRDALDAQERGAALTKEQKEAIDTAANGMRNLSSLSKKYRVQIAAAVQDLDESPESAARLAAAIAEAEKASKGLEEAQREVSKISGQVAGVFGLTSDISGTLVGQVSSVAVAMGKTLDAAGGGGVLGALSAMTMEMFSAERIIASMVQEAMKLAVELDKAGKGFGAATGFNFGAAQGRIQGVSKDLIRSGVTMENVGTSIKSLADNFAGFDPSKINKEMVTTSALLAKIGVGAEASANSMDFMITVMSKTEKQAADLTKELALTGRQIGVSATAMISNFNNAAKKLVEFGPQMISVFKQLSVQAKITGLSMDNLIGIAEKFDTFEGASDQISQMNAVLGTQMSAMDMLNMTHDQRIQTIRNEVKASVGNFDTLDRYTKKYIAQAMGVKDVEEAQRMLNMTNDKTSDKQKAMIDAQDRLKDITEELVPMYDRLKLAFAELVRALDPVVSNFIKFTNNLAKAIESGHFQILVGIMSVATVVITAFGAAVGLASARMKMFQLGLIAFVAMIHFLTSNQIGFAAIAAMVTLLALSFVFLEKSVDESTKKFKFLKLLFGSKINPLFIQSFAFMSLGVLALALAFKIMGIQGTTAAYALGAVFAGMGLVVFALSFLVDSISNLLSSLTESVDILPLVAAGILSIAYSVGALGAATLLSMGAIMFLLVSMSTLGVVFAGIGKFMGISALEGVASSMDRIGNGMDKFANGLSKVKEAAIGMKGITDKAFMAFTTDGSKTSAIISSTDIVKNMVLGKMTVDVKIPEIEIPQVTVNIYMDGSLVSNSLYETILED